MTKGVRTVKRQLTAKDYLWSTTRRKQTQQTDLC